MPSVVLQEFSVVLENNPDDILSLWVWGFRFLMKACVIVEVEFERRALTRQGGSTDNSFQTIAPIVIKDFFSNS